MMPVFYTNSADVVVLGVSPDDTFYGLDGNDFLQFNFTVKKSTTVEGRIGDNSILSSLGNDFVYGGNGDDLLTLMGGKDQGYGGDGKDTLNGDYERAVPISPSERTCSMAVKAKTRSMAAGGPTSFPATAATTSSSATEGREQRRIQEARRRPPLWWRGQGYPAWPERQRHADGGSGDDKLTGGSGADLLTGGAGADQFVYLCRSGELLSHNADAIGKFHSARATRWTCPGSMPSRADMERPGIHLHRQQRFHGRR